MATSGPTNLPAFFNADADFRTWCQGINSALAALGLVNTSDTGQINNTTVSKPAAINTSQGYEIWKFNDSLQSGTPIYLKLEYGSSGAVDRPSIWMTVGSGSNGSGTLTGQLGTRKQIGSGASKTSGVTLPAYFCGNSGELLMAINVDTASSSFGFMVAVERVKDSSDVTQSEGALVSSLDPNVGVANAQYVPASGTVPSNNTGAWCTMAPNKWSRSSSGASVDAAPVFIPIGGVWRYSHLLVTAPGDFAAGGTLTPTILGGTHTYLALDRVCGTMSVADGVSLGAAIRWE